MFGSIYSSKLLFPHSWLEMRSLADLPWDKFYGPKLPQVSEYFFFEKPVSLIQNNTLENQAIYF